MEHEDILETGQPSPSPEPPQTNDSSEVPSISQELVLPPGASQVRVVLEVPTGARLGVDVEARTPDGRLLGRQSLVFGEAALPLPRTSIWSRFSAWANARAADLPLWLFWLSLGVYAFTRLYALPSFPIYFFTDEAIQTVSAADLLRDHFHGVNNELLPAYFQNGTQYNLSASVYLQILPYFLFGKSIWVTRGVTALMTLIAAAAVGLTLKRVFKSPYPWLAVMFLSITPAWFLHSRTAFKTALATSFYAAFLYFYLLYRVEKPRYLYAAVGLGALSWYSYSGMRMVMAVTCVLLFVSDLKYHWQNRAVVLRGLGLAVLLALPFVRFLINHPDASRWQMRLLGSYWILDIPLVQKLAYFATEYLHGLDPIYWYLPNNWDLSRHVLLGYGHVLRQTLPLVLFGIALALRRFRNPAYRVLLIAFLAAPTGAALVRLGITRVLVMVIPLAILTALGMGELMDWALRRWKKIQAPLLSLAVFAILAGVNLYMTRDALVNGPLWYSDYSLTGQQYGAQQVLGEIAHYLKENPDTHMILSPSWANGTDVVARFFFEDPLPFEMGSITGYFDEVRPLDDNTLFIMIPEEYKKIPSSRFKDVRVEKVLYYPNGQPGFYFVRLKYVPNIQAVMASEEAARRLPKTDHLFIDGQEVKVTYTPLDMGQTKDIFDGSADTLIRTDAINPLQVSLDFPTPRSMQSVVLHVGGAATTAHLKLFQAGQDTPFEMTENVPEAPQPRDVQFSFPEQSRVTRLWIEIQNTNDPPDGNVHLWEVTFR
jgi:hypothetical protein